MTEAHQRKELPVRTRQTNIPGLIHTGIFMNSMEKPKDVINLITHDVETLKTDLKQKYDNKHIQVNTIIEAS